MTRLLTRILLPSLIDCLSIPVPHMDDRLLELWPFVVQLAEMTSV